MGRVYAVVSAKGGVGKTTTAANLASALAGAGSRVAVVDGDLGMANLASALGVDVGEVTLHDVLAGEADVAAAIHEGPHGLSVVPGSPALDAFSRADPERLEGVLDDLAADHDYVILDTGAGLSNDTVVPLTYVDEVLLVSTPTRDALGDTDKTRQVAARLGTTVAGAALLRADPAAAESDVVVETLDVGVLGTVPDAEVIRRAAEAGEPLTTFAPGSPAAASFASLAAALTGEHVAASPTDAADVDADEPTDGTDAGADGGEAADEDAADGTTDEDAADGTTDEDAGDETTEDESDDEPADEDASDDESTDEDVGDDEPTEDESDESTDEETDDATADDTPEADVADPDTDPEDSAVDAVDDPEESPVEPSDSPVGPADPEAVAMAGDSVTADDSGVYTTPLEEVPIEEAEADASESSTATTADADDAPADDDTAADSDDAPADDDTAVDSEDAPADDDDAADSDDEADDSGGGGFFSRFFG